MIEVLDNFNENKEKKELLEEFLFSMRSTPKTQSAKELENTIFKSFIYYDNNNNNNSKCAN